MAAATTGTGKAPSAKNALLWGLLAIFCFGALAGIPAIIYGNRTIKEVAASGGQLSGRGTGVFALVIGWIAIVSFVITWIIAAVTFLG